MNEKDTARFLAALMPEIRATLKRPAAWGRIIEMAATEGHVSPLLIELYAVERTNNLIEVIKEVLTQVLENKEGA